MIEPKTGSPFRAGNVTAAIAGGNLSALTGDLLNNYVSVYRVGNLPTIYIVGTGNTKVPLVR